MKTNTKKTTTAGYKYGRTTYRAKMLKDYNPYGMGVKYAKGTYVRIDGVTAAGLPYIVAGHGLTITFPKAVARLITVTERLPHVLTKRIGGLKRALTNLVNDRKRYYNDVFTTEDVLAIEREVLTRLAALKKAAAPKRPVVRVKPTPPRPARKYGITPTGNDITLGELMAGGL